MAEPLIHEGRDQSDGTSTLLIESGDESRPQRRRRARPCTDLPLPAQIDAIAGERIRVRADVGHPTPAKTLRGLRHATIPLPHRKLEDRAHTAAARTGVIVPHPLGVDAIAAADQRRTTAGERVWARAREVHVRSAIV